MAFPWKGLTALLSSFIVRLGTQRGLLARAAFLPIIQPAMVPPMTQQFPLPITPPPELVAEWIAEIYGNEPVLPVYSFTHSLVERAAQWGADQELEACRMEIIDGAGLFYIDETSDRVRLTEDIRTTRRPKPPSLKEQALALLDKAEDPSWDINDFTIVRRALEQLPDPS